MRSLPIRQWIKYSLLILLTIFMVNSLSSCRGKKRNRSAKTNLRVFQKEPISKAPAVELTKKEGEALAKEAKRYLGTPYKSAGTSRLGMDCSGLVVTSFAALGKTFPRRASEQGEAGQKIDRSKARIGDLVLFADPKVGKGITHVGIVTELLSGGDIKFIHSSSSLGVSENKLSNSYFSKTFHHLVRPAAAEGEK